MKKIVFVTLCLFASVYCRLQIPKGFKFGVATAAYQVEGGWNQDGKGENIWDRYTHTHKDQIKDHSNGDIACDSYHLWRKDVELLEELGVDFYRFSLSWSRILPTGFSNKINKAGVDYYNETINLLISKNIEPMVTLYHWDLPQPLQDLGGWTNSLITDYFEDYARVAFTLFGDRVKLWITINEPASICIDTYENGNGAPGIKSPGLGSYLCGKNILLAHAKAYRLYQADFKNTQQGKVGITIDSIWAEPKSKSQQDQDASDREMQMSFGWYAHPIFSRKGHYPDVMIERIDALSVRQNFTRSRLPSFSAQEIKLLRGSADFLGLNHYHTWLVTSKNFTSNDISFLADKGTILEKDPSWKDPEILPWGFTKLLSWIKDQYDNPLVYITENGIGDTTGTLNDTHRIEFIQEYVKAVLIAINTYECNVSRYTVWSLMDNMEWNQGYTIKFGIYQVDFHSPARTRSEKKSAVFYKGLIMSTELD
ncbi:unnamed protein product [Ceutorhynchus assimilis]|uniref:beta-glucosidase n=1 Tax=Ceutorhynchus assimilis TaxID=467358 RepID=A0A9N9QRZ0_9CUCU|nr:unnamed protein product [Ceutorhynchus assimilis]